MKLSFILLLFSIVLPVTIAQAQRRQETCTTNRNAPPVSSYHWPIDAEVRVYFVRDTFTSEQRDALLQAMKTWTETGSETGSGVKFVYVGENDGPVSCHNCLTVRRREVHKQDKHHYAFFNPMVMDKHGVLMSAWIDLDVGTTKARALNGFMAHEMGHGLGLWDCTTCRKKQTIMNGFPGLNQDNGLLGPSACDLATLKNIYQDERQAVGRLANESTAMPPAGSPRKE